MTKKQIFTLIFFIIFFAFLFWLSSFVWILNTIWTLLAYLIITYLFYFIWKSLFKKVKMTFLEYFSYFFYKVSVWILLSVVILGSFSYYKNEISPTPMPTYYLSNWEKQVVFQAMSHIWTKDFYNNVKDKLQEKKKEGFVYFYEWVKPWTKQNEQKFNEAIWINFDKDLYKNFSKLYWVTNQDNSIYFWLVNNLDFNVDVSIDKIIEEYTKIKTTKSSLEKGEIKKENKEIIDVNSEIIKTLAELNDRELAILRYINKAILNAVIWSDKIQDTVMDNFWNADLFQIILHYRNEIIASEIQKTEYKKIFITYWLLHFDWVFELLKKSDSNWKIDKIEYLYPIR